MLKYLRYYYLNKIVKDPYLAAKIYEMIYHKVKFDVIPPIVNNTINMAPVLYEQNTSKVAPNKIDPKNLQKSELEKTLLYLKAKTLKTKEEKDSIGIIEAVLKNER